jgi:Trk K+ transport system NAD-binding subunit
MKERWLEVVFRRKLTRRHRLVLAYAGSIVAIVLFFTVLYNTGMRTLEGRPQSIFQSFQTVVETLTTTGYGADSPWQTPVMNVLVVAMQVTGIGIGFVTLRILIIPLFERAPLDLTDRLTPKNDHVVVAEYDRNTELLLDELEALDVDYVLLDSEESVAMKLSDDGYQAISGDPEERSDLESATIGRARMLITDAGDRTASIVLTAMEANPDLRVISFTASTRRRAALAEVGVDRSIAPGALIGRRLAEKAAVPVTIDASRADPGSAEPTSGAADIAIREVIVRRESPFLGVPVRESPLAKHPQVALVCGWFDGELRLAPTAKDRLTANTVLVVAGPTDEIDAAASELGRVRSLRGGVSERVVIAGYDEGGHAAHDALPESVHTTTIDQNPGTDPTVVGDATEPETLERADLTAADTLIVTVNDDATTLLTIAMARSVAPDVEILARVTEAEKTSAAFRAGADYVLSLQRVCARLVAGEVHGERVMDPASQIRLVRAAGDPFAGRTIAEARLESEGYTVVGVLRDGSVRTEENTVVGPDDEVFVAGSDEAIQAFERSVES